MGTTNFPYNFINRMGIPLIESASVEVTTDNVVITLANRSFRNLNQKGTILFRLNQEIPTGGDTLPVIFSVNDFTQPLTNIGGTTINGSQMPGIGVYFIYYDKDANIMQLLTTQIPS
jgi:hypothetical protein